MFVMRTSTVHTAVERSLHPKIKVAFGFGGKNVFVFAVRCGFRVSCKVEALSDMEHALLVCIYQVVHTILRRTK